MQLNNHHTALFERFQTNGVVQVTDIVTILESLGCTRGHIDSFMNPIVSQFTAVDYPSFARVIEAHLQVKKNDQKNKHKDLAEAISIYKD